MQTKCTSQLLEVSIVSLNNPSLLRGVGIRILMKNTMVSYVGLKISREVFCPIVSLKDLNGCLEDVLDKPMKLLKLLEGCDLSFIRYTQHTRV